MNDRLDSREIAEYAGKIHPGIRQDRIFVHDSMGSTNSELKRMAADGAEEGTVLLAEEQTEARGRLGRSYFAPKHAGIYMSLLLKPEKKMEEAVLMTAAAAAAVCGSVSELTGKDAGIKWVNDIYIEGKKVCGILAETVLNPKTGMLDSLVIGIGVNFRGKEEMFPPELRERAGWILDEDTLPELSRNMLAGDIAGRIFSLGENLSDRSFMDYYRSRSIVTGKKIRCIRGRDEFEGYAAGIDDDGGLIVETAGGRIVLNSGEITIRW